MIISQLNGGLGNQMFQYAFGKSLSENLDSELKLYLKSENKFNLSCFNLSAVFPSKYELFLLKGLNNTSFINKIVNKFVFSRRVVEEKDYNYDDFLFNSVRNNSFVKGYWQNENYFRSIFSLLKEDFSFNKEITEKEFDFKEKIMSENSVSIHFRRGDYLSESVLNNLGLCPLEYYQKSIDFLASKFKNIVFVIFSNDIAWVKENMKINFPVYFIEKNKDYEDLYLMSLCKHNILANSSFSWWAAWLNKNLNKIVIAPKRWFIKKGRENHSPVPERWVRL